MDAKPTILKIAAALKECKLEAVMIGNAAAALQGAPVTTIDIDFMYRGNEYNKKKIEKLADVLGGTVSQPFIMSSMLRLQADGGICIDFLDTVDGVRSFAGLKSRASKVEFEGYTVLVADLNDIIKSKEKCGRDKDKAIIELLKQTQKEIDEQKSE
jgi:predicted nucleotidyltransferase